MPLASSPVSSTSPWLSTRRRKFDLCSLKPANASTARCNCRKLKVGDVHQTATKESEADMIQIVTNGKGKDMDAFGKDLKTDQIAAIVQYYRSLAK